MKVLAQQLFVRRAAGCVKLPSVVEDKLQGAPGGC
jgi:hypothetical protein